MTILDEIEKMQQKGMTEEEIQQKLIEQGLTPLQVNQTLEQARIKFLVSRNEQEIPTGQEFVSEEMQPSITETPETSEEQIPTQEQPSQEPQYIYPTPQAYYPEYQPYQAELPTDMATEIAESIVEEKISKLKKEIGNISELKTTTERKIENIGSRLQRIEEIIDRLQATILGKIGSYGQSLGDIKKEMSLMQESFSKALPNYAKPKQKTEKRQEPQAKTEKKSKSGIEHYLKR